MNPLGDVIDALGVTSVWTYLALFLAASLLMIWRLEALLDHGLEGTALGTLMFGMISQGFFYTDINDNWYYAFVGAMLVVVVTINSYTRRAAMRQARLK